MQYIWKIGKTLDIPRISDSPAGVMASISKRKGRETGENKMF